MSAPASSAGPARSSDGARAHVSLAVLALVVAAGVALYAGRAWLQPEGAGFPIDDAWIHQTFARNLAERGELAYNPGEPVAGSTSPGWTLLLAVGYGLSLPPLAWAYGLGAAALLVVAELTRRLTRSRLGAGEGPALLAGVLVASEWRMVWAAASGMETLAFTACCLATLHLLTRAPAARAPVGWAVLVGLAVGLATLFRPEGLILLPLAAVAAWRVPSAGRGGTWWRAGAGLALGLALMLVPYLWTNYLLAGTPLPTTFYAKTSAYASGLGAVASFLRDALLVTLSGQAGLWALPLVVGLGLAVHQGWRDRSLVHWAPLIWMGLLLSVYAVRLPVVYHHGRYLLPLVPILMAYAATGAARLWTGIRRRGLSRLAVAAPLVMAAGTAVIWIHGSALYGADVAYINANQVAAARWLAGHTPVGTVVASHDIGALGYFSGRRLVDTGGLISPTYIPLVRNEEAIRLRLQADGVDYLAALPSWYPRLTDALASHLVFQSSGRDWIPAAELMRIYRLSPGDIYP